MSESSLPLQGVRVLERSGALAGRLTGLLLADQGAAVFALDRDDAAEEKTFDEPPRFRGRKGFIERGELIGAEIHEVGGRLGRRIRISRFDDESGRCSGFEV